MPLTRTTKIRRGIARFNTAYMDNKDLPVDSNGVVTVPCIDGKHHNFKQVKQNKFNDSYMFKVRRFQTVKLLTGQKVRIVPPDQNQYGQTTSEYDYYTRLFCGKCSGSVVIRLIREGETY